MRDAMCASPGGEHREPNPESSGLMLTMTAPEMQGLILRPTSGQSESTRQLKSSARSNSQTRFHGQHPQSFCKPEVISIRALLGCAVAGCIRGLAYRNCRWYGMNVVLVDRR
jgi:hypothetical protein